MRFGVSQHYLSGPHSFLEFYCLALGRQSFLLQLISPKDFVCGLARGISPQEHCMQGKLLRLKLNVMLSVLMILIKSIAGADYAYAQVAGATLTGPVKDTSV